MPNISQATVSCMPISYRCHRQRISYCITSEPILYTAEMHASAILAFGLVMTLTFDI